jgi:hypothetical protein
MIIIQLNHQYDRGFRRVSNGVDRDTYFHELFLRGKPRLHERMKRLPSCHRKTPVDKEDRCPDFYELAKTSPLPEVDWNRTAAVSQAIPGVVGFLPTAATAGKANFPPPNNATMMNGQPMLDIEPMNFRNVAGGLSSNGLPMGTGIGGVTGAGPSSSFGTMPDMLSILGGNQIGSNGSLPPPSAPTQNATNGNGSLPQSSAPTDASSLDVYAATLRKQNENLLLRIKLLEYENQVKQQQEQQQQQGSNQQQLNIISGESSANTGDQSPSNNPNAPL